MDRQSRFDITAMVACYNEQDGIGPTLRTLVAALDRAGLVGEVIVMDDASTDASPARAAAAVEELGGKPNLSIKLHRNEANQGLPANVFHCARMGRGRYYWAVAGDNNLSAEVYDALFSRLGHADIIVPNVLRYEGRRLYRKLISKLYVAMVNLLSGCRIRYYNGSSIFRRDQFLAHGGNIAGFGYSAELIITLIDEGASFVEVDVTYSDRESGKSSALRVKHLAEVLAFFARLVRRRLRRRSRSKSISAGQA